MRPAPINPRPRSAQQPGAGLARALSKLGICSRREAFELVRQGKVRVNGAVRHDPLWPVDLRRDRIEIGNQPVKSSARVYLILNKPRGLVTTASDEHGRATVFECLAGTGLPFVSPVGRLDMASEGLLLLTNDTQWSAAITNPASRLEKIYHVQIDHIPGENFLRKLQHGFESEGEILRVARAAVLRAGSRNSWLELTLTEGRNRHIRRLLAAAGCQVRRLIRVAIGDLELGDLPKGKFRHLTQVEVRALGNKSETRNPRSERNPKPEIQDPHKAGPKVE